MIKFELPSILLLEQQLKKASLKKKHFPRFKAAPSRLAFDSSGQQKDLTAAEKLKISAMKKTCSTKLHTKQHYKDRMFYWFLNHFSVVVFFSWLTHLCYVYWFTKLCLLLTKHDELYLSSQHLSISVFSFTTFFLRKCDVSCPPPLASLQSFDTKILSDAVSV